MPPRLCPQALKIKATIKRSKDATLNWGSGGYSAAGSLSRHVEACIKCGRDYPPGHPFNRDES